MAFISKHLGRFLISVTVSVILLSGLVGIVVPAIFEQGNIKVSPETVLPDEPPVIEMRTVGKISQDMTLTDAVAHARSVSDNAELDDTFWQSVLDDEGRVRTYRLHNGYHEPANEFSGGQVSDWILVFTSANAAGEIYTVNVKLSLYDFIDA